MSFSERTAVEIYINASDLSIRLYPFGANFGAVVARGHDRVEIAINCIPPMFTKKEILEKIRRQLDIASKIGKEVMGEESSIFNEAFIVEIMKDLNEKGGVQTHTRIPART